MVNKYQVTDKAGDWVAGKRSPGVGETIELTADAAEYEVMRGVLILAPSTVIEAAPAMSEDIPAEAVGSDTPAPDAAETNKERKGKWKQSTQV